MSQTRSGSIKINARKTGLSISEYTEKCKTHKYCYRCKQWKPKSDFANDVTRYDGLMPLCRICRSDFSRSRYIPKGKPSHSGPLPDPARDGDKNQARRRINTLVKYGKIPHPNTIPCSECGHVWHPGERRHEYDHYLGYGKDHHLDVISVCTICHRRIESNRGNVWWAKKQQ